ncbi:MAG: sensor histidine kinase [Planctomycetota bacterium]|nr:MAG: sensor histidine kinase [Planctomycetota bacterium]
MPRENQKRRFQTALWLIGIWLVPGLLQCVQEVTYASSHGTGPPQLGPTLLHFLPTWLPWAAFSPLILRLVRRFPFRREQWIRSLPIHFFFCLGFGGLHLLALGLIRTNFPPAEWTERDLGTWLARTLWSLHSQAEILAYACVAMAGHALQALQTTRERELRTLKLESQLTEARLDTLRSQLQPHFLFNTLNTIDVLLQESPDRAGEMLRRLSRFLRRTLDDHESVHPLSRELDYLRTYLEIEQVRFSDRLQFDLDVDDAALNITVPNLLLQPLVENALRHGIAPLARGGQIQIRGRVSDNTLCLEVEDNGVGLDPHWQEGIGIGNTRSCLRNHYGNQQSFKLSQKPSGGTLVQIRLPANHHGRGEHDSGTD